MHETITSDQGIATRIEMKKSQCHLARDALYWTNVRHTRIQPIFPMNQALEIEG